MELLFFSSVVALNAVMLQLYNVKKKKRKVGCRVFAHPLPLKSAVELLVSLSLAPLRPPVVTPACRHVCSPPTLV